MLTGLLRLRSTFTEITSRLLVSNSIQAPLFGISLAEERNIDFSNGDVSILGDPTELSLINKMLELPDVIETSVGNLEAHHLPHYSMELATAFHTFYQNCRVVSSEKSDLPISKARLLLVDAARLVLGRCLKLMNMTAPDKM